MTKGKNLYKEQETYRLDAVVEEAWTQGGFKLVCKVLLPKGQFSVAAIPKGIQKATLCKHRSQIRSHMTRGATYWGQYIQLPTQMSISTTKWDTLERNNTTNTFSIETICIRLKLDYSHTFIVIFIFDLCPYCQSM